MGRKKKKIDEPTKEDIKKQESFTKKIQESWQKDIDDLRKQLQQSDDYE